MRRAISWLLPVLLGIALLLLWQVIVIARHIPPYVLPAPSAIVRALAGNFSSLMFSLVSTLTVTLEGFGGALAAGVALAVGFSQSPMAERALYPYAVVMQVTPMVAIAPLILIWVGFERIDVALALIAALVAFFPILSNTTLGLKSADANLVELMRLYGASRWQILWRLRLPTALPYLLGAMKIAGGLSLIGAVVAEFVAGSGTASGLAWRIVEAGNRLEIATMFAALLLLALLGIAIFAVFSWLEWLVLRRWHESAAETQI
ncbi:MAG: ABC transporter permease [Rhizomicrobium sp.]